jgi:ATP-binding cassette subfamily F protein 3
VQRVATQARINLSLNTTQRAGDRVLQVRELQKRFGEMTLWEDVTAEVARGERIGIIGPNGSGKTTMLKVLMGAEPQSEGEVKWGANLSIGYYDQRLDMLKPHHTLMEAIQDGRKLTDKAAREALALMLFGNDDLLKTIDMISGGEKARVRLAQLLLDRHNVLVLDEPTNHLDIASREALEGALARFDGTILCVTHDRYFLDRVVERLWILRPPTMLDFGGSYSDWAEKQIEDAKRAKEPAGGGKGRRK